MFRLIHFNDTIPDIDVGLDGRDKELCKPLLQRFYNSKAYAEIETTALKFLDKKNRRKRSLAIEPNLLQIVVALIKFKGLTLRVSDIWERIVNDLPGSYDTRKPDEYHTVDYGLIYRNTISKTIEGFGAEHDKKDNHRVLVFDSAKLIKACKDHEIEIEVESKK